MSTTLELMNGVYDIAPGARLSDFYKTLNRTVRKISRSKRWNFLRTSNDTQLIEGYSTGTVAVTEGSTTVTGTSTVWTSAMTGRKIKVSGDSQHYTFTFVSTTSGTLDRNYAKDTDSEATYQIYQDTYALPSDFWKLEKIVNLESGADLIPLAVGDYLAGRSDPLLVNVFIGGRAKYTIWGADSSGNPNLLIHRFAGADEFIRIYYIKRPTDVSAPSTEPDLPDELHDWLQLELQVIYAQRVPKEQKDRDLIIDLKTERNELRRIAYANEASRVHKILHNQYNALG